tara:strand:+ start:971 stop:1630 length:660 start_codon:yes stop_codon:yes gene_type:complete
MSRREKLNEERETRILQAIKLGGTYQIAAENAGIARSTLYYWLQKGAKQQKGMYRTFLDRFKKAEAAAALAALVNINRASQNGDVKASIWLLERRRKYGKESQHPTIDEIISDKEEEPMIMSPVEIMTKQATNLRRAIAKAEKAESWQAYAALQRQLISILLQIRQISSEDDNTFEDLSDEQIIGEISTMVMTLPPIMKQRLIDEIGGLDLPNVEILKR